MAGQDGRDGFSGSDGRAGQITVKYDPSAKPYISALHVTRSAQFKEATLQPLW
jgi:ABC-type cobalt transport system substrate-binding protein